MTNVPVVHPHSERGVNAQPGMDQRTPPGTGSATGSGTGSGATGPGSLPGRTDISWNALPGALPPEEGRSFAWTVMGGVGLGLVGATAIAAAILVSSGLLASEPKAAGNTGGIDVAQSPPVTETLALPTPTAATAPAAAPAAPATGAPSSSSDKPAAMDVRAPRPPPTSTTGDTPPPVQTAASTAVVAPAASAPAPPPRPAPPKNNGAFDHL